jgi:hypothetical protein
MWYFLEILNRRLAGAVENELSRMAWPPVTVYSGHVDSTPILFTANTVISGTSKKVKQFNYRNGQALRVPRG